jgi:hypothetical protein
VTASVATSVANGWLTTLIDEAQYAQLHTGDPGSAGTSNVSSVTTRESISWGTVSGGSVSASNEPEWTDWAGTNGEDVTYISLWSSSSGGTFYDSIQLSGGGETVDTGDDLQLTELELAIPVAS